MYTQETLEASSSSQNYIQLRPINSQHASPKQCALENFELETNSPVLEYCAEPLSQVYDMQQTALRANVLHCLLVDGAGAVPRHDEERALGALASLKVFVERARKIVRLEYEEDDGGNVGK